MNTSTIDSIFAIYAVEDDYIISKKGDVSICYRFSLPQIYSLTAESIEIINERFDKFIRSLPDQTIVQKQDLFFIKKIETSVSTGKDFLSKSDNRFFLEKPIMEHECYLTITRDAKSTVSFSNKLDVFEKYANEIDEFFKRIETSVQLLVKDGIMSVHRLKTDDIIALFGKYFNLNKEGHENLSDMFFDRRLQIGSKLGEIYTITTNEQLPISYESEIKHTEYSTPKTDFMVPFIQPLSLGLNCEHFYNQIIYIENSDAIFKKLKTKMNNFNSLAMLSKENEIVYRDINELVENVIEKELRFVSQHYNLFVWSNSEADIERDRSNVENVFREMRITPFKERYSIKEMFFYNCPGAAALINPSHRFIGISKYAASLINFESYYESNHSGILFADRKNEGPVRLDLWDEPVSKGVIVNRNRLIFGPSGTGKSFLVNHIASQYHEQGHHVVMIDIGNSYRKLCNLVKGSYFTYEVENPLEFNPFYFRDQDEIDVEKKVFLVSLIMFLWKGEDEYKREEKQIVAIYLDAYYEMIFANEDCIPCMSTFYEFVDTTTVLESEEKYFDKTSFQLSLRDFHDGKYKDVLNFKEPVDLVNQRFIVFEMDNIKDHPVLFPLITMLSIDLVMTKIKKLPSVKKSIFIDECWKPISKGEMAEFIKYLYKTVRKFYGEVAIATQDVEDILETAAGPAMINNTDTMILLSHKKKMASKDKFSKYLSFSESDLQKLFSTEKGEVFLKVGSLSNVYKVKVSQERYACYSSNADDNKIIYNSYNNYENMVLAINEFNDYKNETK